MKLEKTIEESTKEIEELSEMESLLRRVMLLEAKLAVLENVYIGGVDYCNPPYRVTCEGVTTEHKELYKDSFTGKPHYKATI